MSTTAITANPNGEEAIKPEEEIIEPATGRYSFKEIYQFTEEYQRNGRNATKAVMVVRPWLLNKPERAKDVGSRMLKKIDAESADMVLALRSIGVSAKTIAEKIMVLLDSKIITKTFFHNGSITIVEEDNINAIDKGLIHALKIGVGGGYKAEEIRQSGVVGHAHFNLGDIFEKARQKEMAIKKGMDPEAYERRVDTIVGEVLNREQK